MYGLHIRRLSEHLLSALGQIRVRTWVMLGGFMVGTLALAVWAVVGLMSWLWGQLPAAIEIGKRLSGETTAQIERVAPGLQEQVRQWVGIAEESPKSDVAGADIGPVPRYPGLVRSYFARAEETLEVGYTGRAPVGLVRAHYIQGFTMAGYAGEVLKATADMEHHRFKNGKESIDLLLFIREQALVEISMTIRAIGS